MYKTFRLQYLGTNKDLKSINTVIILFEYLIIFKYHIPIISSHEKRLKIKTLKGYSKIGGFLFRKWKISCLEKINILLCMYHRYKKVKNLKKKDTACIWQGKQNDMEYLLVWHMPQLQCYWRNIYQCLN